MCNTVANQVEEALTQFRAVLDGQHFANEYIVTNSGRIEELLAKIGKIEGRMADVGAKLSMLFDELTEIKHEIKRGNHVNATKP